MKSINKPLVHYSGSRLFDVLSMLLIFSLGCVLGLISNASFQKFYHPPSLPSLRQSPLLLDTPCIWPPLNPKRLPAPPAPLTTCMGLAGFLSPSGVKHNMTDEELLWKASMAPTIDRTPFSRVPKVALLFLVRGELPLRPLWEKFLAGHEGLYSIYVHTNPDYTGSPPKDSVFYGRMIPSQKTSWGDRNLVDAERRLLANALLDFSNERFALLSEACIPIFNFTTVYAYLTGSNASFVESGDDFRSRARYNPAYAAHNISRAHWRKGSQWFEMDRALALEVVADRRWPVLRGVFNESRGGVLDEHYLPTLASLLGWGARNANRSVTYLEWQPRTSHPWTRGPKDVTEELLGKMRGGEGKNCTYNGGVSQICFVFARKFSPDSLGKLLELAPKVMGFG